MFDNSLLEVTGLRKKFCKRLKPSLYYGAIDLTKEVLGIDRNVTALRPHEFWVLDNISFKLSRGECIGILGRNGAGKSTLLKMINGAMKPDMGKIAIRGNMVSMIELGMGFDPILTGLENIYTYGAILGLTPSEVEKRIPDIIEFSELGDFIHTPLNRYSSGMRLRLGFSVAVQTNPDILILDEVLAVGDVGFRAKCLDALGSKLKSSGVLLVTHNMNQVSRLCTSVIVLQNGKPTYYNDISEGIKFYQKLSDVKTKSTETKFTSGKILIENLDFIIKKDDFYDLTFQINPVGFSGKIKGYIHVVNHGGLTLGALHDEQFEVNLEHKKPLQIAIHGVRIPLTGGLYGLQIVFYTADGKELLIWYKNVCPFSIETGRYYQTPFIFAAQTFNVSQSEKISE